jgi:hypothetical protein
MRTTLKIADDVLLAAKELAKKSNKTTGHVISELARKGLESVTDAPAEFMGFRPLPRRGNVVTSELVNQLREEFGD